MGRLLKMAVFVVLSVCLESGGVFFTFFFIRVVCFGFFFL